MLKPSIRCPYLSSFAIFHCMRLTSSKSVDFFMKNSSKTKFWECALSMSVIETMPQHFNYLFILSKDSVLDCWWIRGSLDCYTEPGFTYDKRISRTLNITINYKTKPTGKYACQVAGYNSALLTTCEFVFKLGKQILF